MSRRKNLERSSEPAVHKPPTRVPRRRRRKPPGSRPQSSGAPARTPQRVDELEDYRLPGTDTTQIKLSRAPRSAEPPAPNPDVFSYTFTIWKST